MKTDRLGTCIHLKSLSEEKCNSIVWNWTGGIWSFINISTSWIRMDEKNMCYCMQKCPRIPSIKSASISPCCVYRGFIFPAGVGQYCGALLLSRGFMEMDGEARSPWCCFDGDILAGTSAIHTWGRSFPHQNTIDLLSFLSSENPRGLAYTKTVLTHQALEPVLR